MHYRTPKLVGRLRPLIAATLLVACTAATANAQVAQTREQKVRGDRAKYETNSKWIYNDLPRGFETAKETGKPMLVVFRCIPCEACAKLDEQIVERDPIIQALMDRYVCVRIVHANGLDLSLFQYDYDQSFAAFLMNADRTIYARFGTRSHQTESHEDVSVEGFAKVLAQVLKFHEAYPLNRALFTGKTGQPSEVAAPEQLSTLKDRFGPKLNYEGDVVKSCIHCHMVGEALRREYRLSGDPIPSKVLFPYPHPKILGLIMDPAEMAIVKQVVPGSTADKAGFQAGDQVALLDGQPMLSIADMQWVLHNTGSSATLPVRVVRDKKLVTFDLTLEEGWREKGDISWRVSSWDMGRMVFGGMRLESMTDDEIAAAGLSPEQMALRVRFVGQYGEHARAKRAGLQKGDIITSVNGESKPLTESELLAHMMRTTRPGDDVEFEIRRGKRQIQAKVEAQ
ncbi:MAG: PDZ domain-containing protein [Planctomycetales bacterium]|nr:PDZ domain-containing protein [Planctomycetales bacterium]